MEKCTPHRSILYLCFSFLSLVFQTGNLENYKQPHFTHNSEKDVVNFGGLAGPDKTQINQIKLTQHKDFLNKSMNNSCYIIPVSQVIWTNKCKYLLRSDVFFITYLYVYAIKD